MRLRVLGCNGGITPGHGTSAFLINDSLLVDSGTGVENLTLLEMSKVRSVLLTHSHLDHISHLPFLLNNIINSFEEPVQVFGIPQTIEALKKHIFNDIIWPDFLILPTPKKPCVVLNKINYGDILHIDNFEVEVVPVQHSIPAAGFVISSKDSSIAFTGDCYENDVFWLKLNERAPVDMLIVDNQYKASEKEISRLAQHYFPSLLRKDLLKLNYLAPLFLTNVPPSNNQEILDEIDKELESWNPTILKTNDCFVLNETEAN